MKNLDLVGAGHRIRSVWSVCLSQCICVSVSVIVSVCGYARASVCMCECVRMWVYVFVWLVVKYAPTLKCCTLCTLPQRSTLQGSHFPRCAISGGRGGERGERVFQWPICWNHSCPPHHLSAVNKSPFSSQQITFKIYQIMFAHLPKHFNVYLPSFSGLGHPSDCICWSVCVCVGGVRGWMGGWVEGGRVSYVCWRNTDIVFVSVLDLVDGT